MPKFGVRSLANFEKVHPILVSLFNEIIQHWDCSVTDGIRTDEEQEANIARGVSQTKNSKHLAQPDGLAHAVDVVPYPIDWNAVTKGLDALKRADPGLQTAEFYGFIGFVQGFAAARGIEIRVGADWDGDREFSEHTFIDLPHFELRNPVAPATP